MKKCIWHPPKLFYSSVYVISIAHTHTFTAKEISGFPAMQSKWNVDRTKRGTWKQPGNYAIPIIITNTAGSAPLMTNLSVLIPIVFFLHTDINFYYLC